MPQRSISSRKTISPSIGEQVNAYAALRARKTGDAAAIHPQEAPKALAYALLPPSAWGMETPQAAPSEEN